ncbi:hypothetical protein [Vibrio phage Vaf1]|uniref:hypothetical protein n=1 Tax=Vibrio alginolyticus TaxID=663 RepID=UPI001967D2EB|nr:hypothetical protein [Vibrio alginolyticus]MBN2998604.1 hypothetical protein [Vibrio alginolyticus]UYD72046.1 hypothetical protein [Vibrio phage Vaf1]
MDIRREKFYQQINSAIDSIANYLKENHENDLVYLKEPSESFEGVSCLKVATYTGDKVISIKPKHYYVYDGKVGSISFINSSQHLVESTLYENESGFEWKDCSIVDFLNQLLNEFGLRL